MTAEQVKVDLKAAVAEFMAAVEKRMDEGDSFELAVMTVCKARPDLVEKENSLRDHLKALQSTAAELASLSIRDQRAWSERRTIGAISCAAVTRLAGAAKRLPIAQVGVRWKGKQRVDITRAMLAEVVANFRKRDTGEVPIDYDHAIETAAGSGGPVIAAGWIKSIDDRPDGEGILWGTVLWTPRAAQMISSGEYKYISPVIDPSVRDNKTGEAQGWTLTSAALTNQPVLQGMPALVLSESGLVGETHTREATNGMNNGNSNGDGYPDRCGAFVPTAGYTNQDWDAVQLEIKRRAQRLMDADKRLDYAAAEEAVHQGDPSLARKEWDAIQTEINRRVKQWMAGDFTGRKLDYQTALQTVMGADAFLVRRHTAAKNRILGTPGVRPIDPKLGEVDLEIQPLVQAKIAASEGRMDYWPAWRAVLNERPDLARRRQAAKGW